MIDHKNKFIFIHIPKTAGRSIEKALGVVPGSGQHGHLKPSSGNNPKFWNAYYTFTFVRNPWDRALSTYFYDKKLPHRRGCAKEPAKMGFKKFVRLHLKKYKNQATGIKTTLYIPQSAWLKVNYNFIGRFEDLQKEFDIVCDNIGLSRKILPHASLSATVHKPYWEYYDEETIDIISTLYKGDIRMFNYKFAE